MVVLPAGTFMMGPVEGEHDWAATRGPRMWLEDEIPRHEVHIPRSFSIGRYEVTRGQYRAFVEATGHVTDNCYETDGVRRGQPDPSKDWRNPGFDQEEDHPVVCISWDDAQAYVRWLSGETGKHYRLPSEAEWEYAARAGTDTMRYWGSDQHDTEACAYANAADLTLKNLYPGDWGFFDCRDGYMFTAPVGSFGANGSGLYDILGNVSEWTEDCYNESYIGAPTDGSAWTDGHCSLRVQRGGSWGNIPRNVRAADRHTRLILRASDFGNWGTAYGGFRVVRSNTSCC